MVMQPGTGVVGIIHPISCLNIANLYHEDKKEYVNGLNPLTPKHGENGKFYVLYIWTQ